MKKDLCKHGLYGTLCHICFPEYHEFLVVLGDGSHRIFHKSSTDKAMSMVKRVRGISLYRRVFETPEEKHHSEPPVEETT